jgi:hypothetical protein
MTWREFWHDSVWSKVISTGIIGILGWAGGKALGLDWKTLLLARHDMPGWGIAACGVLVLVLIATVVFRWRNRAQPQPQTASPVVVATSGQVSKASSDVKLTFLESEVSVQAGKTYPLKYYIYFRNDSQTALDIRILDYLPEMVHLQKKVFEAIQVKWNGYFPQPDAAARVAVHPGQMIRIWLALDPATNSTSVKAYTNHVGTLVLSVNGSEWKIHL